MIARHWRGCTRPEDADAYEDLLSDQIMPSIRQVPGCHGGYLLRGESEPNEVEFVVIHVFESLDALREFTGEDYAKAVIEPEARALLCRADEAAVHYAIRVDTLQEPGTPDR